jgi:hypothetical protein
MKKRKKPSRNELEIYSIKILDWELSYSFSVNFNKEIIDGKFWEPLHLRLMGRFVHPEKLVNSTIEVTLIGDRSLVSVIENPEKYRHYEPSAVGTLKVRGKQREFFGSIPFDVLNNMSFLLQVGKIKFLVLDGQPLYRGSAPMRSISFQKDFTAEDLS